MFIESSSMIRLMHSFIKGIHKGSTGRQMAPDMETAISFLRV